eukprot:TRINITY_DN27872_c0_g1_i1.p1 TRINITY_DN27872_c0_g1~~TRINITY_DN27872_c0_g1_i1.p1  ORF type:complete len:375 (-),score=46.22 TRINITY_DN27872_c0_g1_i1:59-1129(-)
MPLGVRIRSTSRWLPPTFRLCAELQSPATSCARGAGNRPPWGGCANRSVSCYGAPLFRRFTHQRRPFSLLGASPALAASGGVAPSSALPGASVRESDTANKEATECCNEPQRIEALAAAPVPVIPLVGFGISEANLHWWFDSCVGFGSAKAGLPAIAAVAVFVAPMQAMRGIVADRSVRKLPLMPYSAMMVNGMLWTTYGLLIGSSGVWVPSVICGVLGLGYTAVFLRYCPADADWLPGGRGIHVGGSVAVAGAVAAAVLCLEHQHAVTVVGVLGDVFEVAMFAGPLAATRTVLQERSTRNLPFGFTIVSFVSCILWTFYAYAILEDIYVLVPNFLGLIASVMQLALFARFGINRC